VWRRFGFMLATGLALTGAFGAYSLLIAPLVRMPQRTAGPNPAAEEMESQRPADHVRIANQWLSSQEWTSTAKYLLRTDDMFIFANEWSPRGDQGQIRFRPFAAVWLSKDKQGVEQAVTVCAESALLKFQSNFQFDNPQPGRVTGGSLDGEVQIRGPDGLDISGQNFYFSEGTRSIFSHSGNQSPITFRFGENKGQAGHLLIKLIKSEGVVPKDRPNIIGVESIELSRNVNMQLKLDDDKSTPPIVVKCTGTFEYRMESKTAIYEKNVVAYRRDPKSPTKSDRLLCDRLSVQFEPKSNIVAAVPAKRPEGDYQQIERNLQFRGLKAEGERVGIASDDQDLKAVMTLLTYDAPTRTIEMSSPRAVQVEQKQTHLQCPVIRLVLGEGNSLDSALCQGTGWLESFDETTGELAFAADWMKELRKVRDPETDLDLIELEEDASFRQPSRDTALGADLIRLWFTPMEASSRKNGGSMNFAGPGGDTQPKRLLAVKNVALVSPQLEAEARHELEVLFEDAVPGSKPAGDSLGRRASRAKLKPTTGNAVFASVPPEETGRQTADTTRPPMIVNADTIRVSMKKPASAEASPEVSQIWTLGHVRVEQPAEDGGEPLVVTGEKMHVENESATRQIVHVYGEEGRPAHIRDERQKLHIEGQTIHLDRAENLAWVEGRGLLQLPVPKSLDGQELSEPQLLDVWWQDRMDFDGLLATFEGDVRAILAEGKMRCETMQVALTQRISFSEENSDRGSPEVRTVVCRDGVEFENHRYEEDQLVEILLAKAFEFQLDHAAQTTNAQGPGWMQMWRRGSGKRAGLSATETVQANRVSLEPSSDWEYTRVDFAGKMTGQIAKKRTSFHDRVAVVYGPVQKPTDVFDKHHLPKDGGWMRCDTLQVVQTAANGDGKSFVQLLGAGDARLEGRGFSGRADQVSYDETKEKYVLRSLGHRKATIWREKSPGDQQQAVDAQQIEFIPSANHVKITQATGGEGSQ